MAGLYIHIPFCASRCIYCGFYSTVQHARRSAYVDALIHEMCLRKGFLSDSAHIDTIYIGGGTPSQLDLSDIERLYQHVYDVFGTQYGENTFEVNPDDVDMTLAECLAENGVTRVSMGVQTFDDTRLRWLHRRHTASQVYGAIENLHKAGIEHISIDLMYGFPLQTMKQWKDDIRHAVQLNIDHISAYSLMYEKGTPLCAMLERKEVSELDEDTSVEMYRFLVDALKNAGYEHYEISNFAKKGCRAIHNSNYWNDTPYIGIGASAHSYSGKVRQWNVSDINKYMKSISADVVPAEVETIDADTHFDDLVTTALRTSDGIDLTMLLPRYRDFLLSKSKSYMADHSVEICGNRLRITEKGFLISDMIMSDLMIVE